MLITIGLYDELINLIKEKEREKNNSYYQEIELPVFDNYNIIDDKINVENINDERGVAIIQLLND